MRARAAGLTGAIILLISLLTACSGGAPAPGASTSGSGGDVPTVSVDTRWASANGRDLKTLLATNSQVFVGRVSRLIDQRDEPVFGSDAAPIASPATGTENPAFPISRFEVAVLRPLKGDLQSGAVVTIEQPGGLSQQSDGTTARLILEGDEPLAPGSEYLFFASQKANGSLTAAPFGRFAVDAGGHLQSPPAWAGLGGVQQLSGKSVDEVKGEIDASP